MIASSEALSDSSTHKPIWNPAPVSLVHQLFDACRDAARITRHAAELTLDSGFKEWLWELQDVHEQSARRFKSLLEDRGIDVRPGLRIRSRARCVWMRIADSFTAGSPLVLMAACRREEFRVQSAYELCLWLLPADALRDAIETRFQKFLLRRSIIPVRRLPRTEQFLMQAERLQKMQSTETEEEFPTESDRLRSAERAARSVTTADAAMVSMNGTQHKQSEIS